MRWAAKPVRHWRPGFAFFPLRDGDRMVWLEPIWTRFCGYYSEWMPWEARPNDPLSSWSLSFSRRFVEACAGNPATDTLNTNLPHESKSPDHG